MSSSTTPFSKKLSYRLITISLIFLGLYLGQTLILPLLFAILLATLLLPTVKFLLRHKFPNLLSILLPLGVSILLGSALIYFLSVQVLHFTDDLPTLKERVAEVVYSFKDWVTDRTHITMLKQNQYIQQVVENLKENAPAIAGRTFGSITDVLIYIVLLPIYTFLVLFYRGIIKSFLLSIFSTERDEKVANILTESVVIGQQYVTGLLIETTLVFTLNIIGFLILGIQYAIFLGLLAALLNLIPYVGMLTANILCMLITLISSDSATNALWVGLILGAVQFIDNNVGMPIIVGKKVRINALVTIVGVLLGGTLCGIPGMFLAIPALAVCKVICDRVERLKPWGLLLGDKNEEPSLGPTFK